MIVKFEKQDLAPLSEIKKEVKTLLEYLERAHKEAANSKLFFKN